MRAVRLTRLADGDALRPAQVVPQREPREGVMMVIVAGQEHPHLDLTREANDAARRGARRLGSPARVGHLDDGADERVVGVHLHQPVWAANVETEGRGQPLRLGGAAGGSRGGAVSRRRDSRISRRAGVCGCATRSATAVVSRAARKTGKRRVPVRLSRRGRRHRRRARRA